MKKIYIFYFLFFSFVIYRLYKKYLKATGEGFEMIKSCNDFCGLQGKLNVNKCDKYNNNKYIKCKDNNGKLVIPNCNQTNINKCI